MSQVSTFSFARLLSKAGSYILTVSLLLPTLALGQGESNGSVTLYPNNTSIDSGLNANVAPRIDEIVTVGIPFTDCTLFNSGDFRLFDDNGAEVQVYVESLMVWPSNRQPCNMASIRVLKVQFEFDATGDAPAIYTWDLQGPRATVDYDNAININDFEVVHDNRIKGGFMEPRVFAINDPLYLVQTGVLPPTVPYAPGDYDDHYYPAMWDRFANQFDFTTSTAANWLFDRVSALYRQAMRTGDVLQYREAYVSHEFYIDKIEVTGRNTNIDDYCIGGFDFDSKANNYGDNGGAGCDGKYFYTQNIRLHLSLTGDDSWTPADNGTPTALGIMDSRDDVWIAIANLLYAGDYRGCKPDCGPATTYSGFSQPYDEIGDYYSERGTGVGLQAVLSTCQLTLDPIVCGWVDAAVDTIYEHQTNNPDGRGNLGYLAHSWHRHEGSTFPYMGELVQDFANATTIIIDGTVDDGPGYMSAGNAIILGITFYELTADPTENPDGSWTLKLATPFTGLEDQQIKAGLNDINTINSSNNFLDISSDRAFSPWMQSMIADGIWEYYFWTEDAAQKAKAEALLLGFGRAIAANAIDGKRIAPATKALVENAFGVRLFSTPFTQTGCGLTMSPILRYAGNDLMGTAPDINNEYMTYILGNSSGSDAHTPEALFQLSLGILFETDSQKKAAMRALADDMQEWFTKHSCTAAAKGYPTRALNWQTKADPFGTYAYVTQLNLSNDGANNTVDSPEAAISYSGSIFQENAVNNGGTSTVITIQLSGDTFQNDGNFNDDEVVIAGIPAGLTASMTRVDNDTITFKLVGKQVPHAIVNSVAGISLHFTDNAFDTNSAADILNSVKNNFSINFRNAILSYNSDTFLESSSNLGASTTFLTTSLSGGETFVVNNGPMNGSHFTATNVPPNMTVKVAGTSNTTARVELTGNASSHSTDINNLTVTFHNAAFSGGSATSVVNATKSDIKVDFINLPDVDDEVVDAVEDNAPINNGKPKKKPQSKPVPQGSKFTNSGTLTDVENQGTIVGGMLEGEVNNKDGILSDVTLAPATQISGGLIQGSLMGSGSVSKTLLDVDALDSDISIGPVTQVTSKTVRNVEGLNLTAAILDESGTPDINFPLLNDSELGELSLADLTEQGLNGYYNNSGSVTGFSTGGSIVLTNAEMADSVIPVEPSMVITTNQPDGVVLTSDGNLEIISHGISMKFTPTPLDDSSISSNIKPLKNGLVSIQMGEATLFQRYGWMASRPNGMQKRQLSGTSEATIEVVGSGRDPASQKVIVHYPDQTTQTMISYLDSLPEFAAIVAQSEYKASFTIDPLTGIMQFFDPDMNLIHTAIPDVVSQPAESSIIDAVLVNAGDLNGDGYPEFYFKTPIRTQLIYGLAP